MNTNVSSDSEQQNQSSHPLIRSFYNLQRLKDFKVNGSIGGPEERDKLSYTSLAYQSQDGRTARFCEAEICTRVIKAIAPGHFLRLYLELKSFVTVDSLIQIMRGHFKEKNLSSTFTELSNAVQSSTG